METDPSFNFDFFLAEKLGKTVGELHATLTAAEWVAWGVYYGREAQRRELESKRG